MTNNFPYFNRPYISRFNRYQRRCLTKLLGQIESDLTRSGVVSRELVRTYLLGVVSLVCQGVANVAWPSGRALPLGFSSMVISETTSGKSLIDGILMKPISTLLEQVAEDTKNIKVPFALSVDEATRAGIFDCLDSFPLLGVITDEGEQIKDLLKTASATVAKLLKGERFRAARGSSKRISLSHYKCCMTLLMQPTVFWEIERSLGLEDGGVGTGNRFSIAFAPPIYSAVSRDEVFLSSEVDDAYVERMRVLLRTCLLNAQNGFEGLPTIHLAADAKAYFLKLEEEALLKCLPGGEWASNRAKQGRYPEHVLISAGLMHTFEYGPIGEISLDTLQCAKNLQDDYSASYAQGTYKPPPLPKRAQEEIDADALMFRYQQLCYPGAANVFYEKDLRTDAINNGLTATRFVRALAVLGNRKLIHAFNQKGKTMIQVYPYHL